MCRDRRHHRGSGFDAQLDPIADLQAGILPRVLDHAHQLARDAFATQVLVQIQVERHGETAVAGHAPALAHVLGQVDVVAPEVDVAARERQGDALATSERSGERPVVVGQRGRHLLDPGSQRRAERLEVGFGPPATQLLGGLREGHPLDVELVGDDVEQRCHRRVVAGVVHDGFGERLANPRLGLHADGPSQAHDRAGRRHGVVQAGIARGLVGVGVVGQVHRVRPPVAAGGQVLPQRLS